MGMRRFFFSVVGVVVVVGGIFHFDNIIANAKNDGL